MKEEDRVGKLEGRIALITGGNSGIGLATAKRFVSEGAYVFITGRREKELAAAVKEIGSNITAVQGDVSNLADLDRLFDRIKREKERLDIVFANAGFARQADLGQITEELYNTTFNINVKGVLFTVQKALPLMPVAGEFLLMPPSVFDRARDSVAANDMIGDSHPWNRTLRSDFLPSARHDCDTRCSSL
jgi:NAD(P)-dependent dehydrogenase (short-subunit alcohol dehydrogenase family)